MFIVLKLNVVIFALLLFEKFQKFYNYFVEFFTREKFFFSSHSSLLFFIIFTYFFYSINYSSAIHELVIFFSLFHFYLSSRLKN